MRPRLRSDTPPSAAAAWLVVLLVASVAAAVFALRDETAGAELAMLRHPPLAAQPQAATGTTLLPLALRLRAAEN